MTDDLTSDERKAVAALQRLAKRWPKSLWLFSASGSLHVLKKVQGRRVMVPGTPRVGDTSGGGADPEASVAVIDIENDGGDW